MNRSESMADVEQEVKLVPVGASGEDDLRWGGGGRREREGAAAAPVPAQ